VLTVKISGLTKASLMRYRCHNKSRKTSFLDDIAMRKIEYLENRAMFFQTACIEIYQTLAPITFTKISQIGGHQLRRVDPDLHGMTKRKAIFVSIRLVVIDLAFIFYSMQLYLLRRILH
jgi:hypothetical protein